MSADSNKLERDIDETRRRIAAAQQAMVEKLEVVERQVRETVAGAQSAIDDVASNVKGTISDTAHSIKQTFDLPHQTRKHPWLFVGGAVLVGYLLGGRNGGSRFSKNLGHGLDSSDPYQRQVQQGLAGGVLNQFKGEIGSLRSAAVGAIITALWEIAKQSLSATNERKETRETLPSRFIGKNR
jgi:hypothetical protein